MKVPIEIAAAYSLMRKRAEENAKFDLVAWIRNKIKTKGTMSRRILMTGKDAKYINVHGKGVQSQDRDILLTGDNAEYIEVTVGDNREEYAIDK